MNPSTLDQQITSSTGFSIMNLNLRFGRAEDGPNHWRFRKVAYGPLIGTYPSDFFMFQEANDFQVKFLSQHLGGYQVIGERRPAPDYWQSNVVYAHPRWQCLHHDHFYLSATPDVPSQFRQSRWPRQCTIGTFRSKDKVVTLINTHFDFDAEVQRRSAELITQRLSDWGYPGPVVLAGDFNAEPSGEAYDVFTSTNANFRNAFKPPFPGTYHEFSGSAKGGAIDWVLYRGPLKVAHATIIGESFDGLFPSDHFPLWVVFNWLDV